MHDFRMVTIRATKSLSPTKLLISKDLAALTALQNEQEILFKVGKLSRTVQVRINTANQLKNTITINSSLARKFYLREQKKYGVKLGLNEIALGPVVGIMAEVCNQPGKPFGGQSFFIKQLIINSKKIGMICFGFSPFAFNWEKKTVTGYIYGQKGWIKSTFPMPDVVYPRERGYSAANRRIRNRMEAMGIKLLNPALVGKWQTHKVISNNPRLTEYIPDTKLITNFKQVENMIKKYHAVYLKPVTGSQGRNIIKVVKKKNSKSYRYQYQLDNQTHSGTAENLERLRSSLRRVMGNRKYIIQKQINLLRSGGSILDVRVLVQKDHSGEWSPTGIACRVGKQGSITSNISSGGRGLKVDRALKRHFPDQEQVDDIIRKINDLAIMAAQTLEKKIGKAGEMGVDIGVDNKGNIWFIEANLRPARQVFLLIGEKTTRLRSVVKPLLYSRYLAGFEEKRGIS